MGIERSGDAAGGMAIAPRALFQNSSANPPLALPGGAAEGGLLATFDAIFRQTMAPAPLTPPPPAPTIRDAGASDSPAADRFETRESSATEDDQHDEERSASESTTATVEPPQVRGEAPSESPASAEASVEEAEAVVAVDREAEPKDTEASEPVAEAVAETEEPTAEKVPDALPVDELPPPTAAAEVDGVDATQVAASQPPQAPAAEPPVQPIIQTQGEETAAVDGAAPAAAVPPTASEAAEETPVETKATPAPQRAVEVGGDAGEPTTAAALPVEETGEFVVAEGTDPGGEPSQLSDTATSEEAGSAEDRGGADDRGRDRRGRDHDRDTERSGEPASQGAGGERRVAAATAAEKAIDRLVAQMQPIESATETPIMSPMTSGRAAASGAAAVVAAAPAATAPAAAKAERSDSIHATADRLGLDGAEPRRSVGGVKGEAGDKSVQNASNADRVRLVQRVARAFQRLGPSGGRVHVMLHPAALGSVRLDLRIDGNRMDARMTAESEAARSVLREHLPELKQKLADSGLVVERIDVELENQTSGEGENRNPSRDWTGDESGWRRPPQPAPPPRYASPASPATPAPALRSQPAAAPGTRTELDLMA